MPISAEEQAFSAVVGDDELLADVLSKVPDTVGVKRLGRILSRAFTADPAGRQVWLLQLGELVAAAVHEAILSSDEYHAECRRVARLTQPEGGRRSTPSA